MVSYHRYLEAKRSIDDASLSTRIIASLKKCIQPRKRVRAVEMGSGIGTMLTRLLEYGVLGDSEYFMVDKDASRLTRCRAYMEEWALSTQFDLENEGGELILTDGNTSCHVSMINGEAVEFARGWSGPPFNLLVAHLFLDLLNVRKSLPIFTDLLDDEGVFYFANVFDGLTRILPSSEMNRKIIEAYHSVMNKKSESWGYNKSDTGSEVLSLLIESDYMEMIEAGCSDWVVFPRNGTFSIDERDFLHFMIDTIHEALLSHPQMKEDDINSWARLKYEQIDEGRMALIAHQLDVLGVKRRWSV